MDQGRLLAEGRPDQVRASLKASILSVRSPESRQTSRLLREQLSGVTSVDLYGDSVHIVCQDTAAVTRDATRILEQAGIPVDEIRAVAPTLEDVFVNTVAQPGTPAASIVSTRLPVTTRSADAVAVEVKDLTRRFGDFVAVDHLQLRVNTGEIFGFLGPNGAGKSTTIRMLCGLLSPSDGGGRVAGCDIATQAEAIKQEIGYMSQKFSLYDDLTVSENIDFYGGIYGLDGSRLAERKRWALGMAGLEEREHHPTRLLAGGWKQRLSLACAILHRPPIIFLDEPTSGVDPLSRRRFWDLIYDMAGRGRTVFVTTHYMEEAEYCDRVALIYRGRMIALGSPRELKERMVEETILDLRCANAQDLMDDLAALAGVLDVALFGAGLHIKVKAAIPAMARIQALIDQRGAADATLAPIVPTMEDVFVALIEKEDRHSETDR